MKKVIKGKTYNTDASYMLLKHFEERVNGTEITELYETRTGNYFVYRKNHLGSTTREWVVPLPKDIAMKILYGE